MTATATPEKIARHTDRFIIAERFTHTPEPYAEIARLTGDPARREFTRAELQIARVYVIDAVRNGILVPMQDTSPEAPHIPTPEILRLYMPDSKDVTRSVAAAFALAANPREALAPELYAATNVTMGNQWVQPLTDYLLQIVTPAALLTLLEAQDSQNREVSAIAWNVLTKSQPQRFAGKGANDAMPLLIDRLNGESYRVEAAPLFLELLRVNRPARSLALYRAVTKYQNNSDAAARDAAQAAFYEIFLD